MVLMSADEQLFFVRSHIFQQSEGKVSQEDVKRWNNNKFVLDRCSEHVSGDIFNEI